MLNMLTKKVCVCACAHTHNMMVSRKLNNFNETLSHL